MVSDEEKEKFLAALREQPIVSVVCKRFGISKASIYRWREEDLDFKKKFNDALESGKEVVNDLAESKLIAAIQRGERWAIVYWLEFNKRLYYKPRRALLPPSGRGPIGKLQIQVVDSAGNQLDSKLNTL